MRIKNFLGSALTVPRERGEPVIVQFREEQETEGPQDDEWVPEELEEGVWTFRTSDGQAYLGRCEPKGKGHDKPDIPCVINAVGSKGPRDIPNFKRVHWKVAQSQL